MPGLNCKPSGLLAHTVIQTISFIDSTLLQVDYHLSFWTAFIEEDTKQHTSEIISVIESEWLAAGQEGQSPLPDHTWAWFVSHIKTQLHQVEEDYMLHVLETPSGLF